VSTDRSNVRRKRSRDWSRTWLAPCGLLLACLGVCLAPGVVFATTTSLPDARVYELVSPIEKHGNEAGASRLEGGAEVEYTVAGADGNSLLYGGTGPFGDVSSGADFFSVAQRSGESGWSSTAALPAAYGASAGNYLEDRPSSIYPAADMSRSVFTAGASYVPGDPPTETNTPTGSEGVFLASLDKPIEWLSEPREGTSGVAPVPQPGDVRTPSAMLPAGGSPNLEIAYFGYFGTLLPADDPRAASVFAVNTNGPWGFYESRGGVLAPAGVLPDGSLDPWGAAPAGGLSHFPNHLTPDDFNNQVSSDGERAFFVSPDPSTFGVGPPTNDPPELYVREGGRTSVLVSRNSLEGGSTPTPAQGPAGRAIVGVSNPDACSIYHECLAYVYASQDGSRAIFESYDKLATSIAGEMPSGSGPWAYEFNVDTEVLRYLPGVTDGSGGTAPVLASSSDGSRFLFAKDDVAGDPTELDVDVDGQITRVSPLPSPSPTFLANGEADNGGTLDIAPARASTDGSVFVFETDSPLPGGFNNAGGYNQVYRYEAGSGKLSCVSCPSLGVPSGDARLSNDDDQTGEPKADKTTKHLLGSRGISADGTRVFFDTPEPLVADDINGQRDVYEWENGEVHLISSGTSPQASVFLDNGASGNDVFFATTQDLSETDPDGSYDVYDARVGGGFPMPPSTAACSNDCQGAVSAPPVFGVPASASLSGSGDIPPVVSTPAKKTTKKATKKKKKTTKKKAKKAKGKKAKAKKGKQRAKARATVGRRGTTRRKVGA
jgi:hypothetical protein